MASGDKGVANHPERRISAFSSPSSPSHASERRAAEDSHVAESPEKPVPNYLRPTISSIRCAKSSPAIASSGKRRLVPPTIRNFKPRSPSSRLQSTPGSLSPSHRAAAAARSTPPPSPTGHIKLELEQASRSPARGKVIASPPRIAPPGHKKVDADSEGKKLKLKEIAGKKKAPAKEGKAITALAVDEVEETANKAAARWNKVKALVGAFESVISSSSQDEQDDQIGQR